MRVKMFFMVCVFLAGVYAVSSDPLSQRRKDSADADVSLVRESRQASSEYTPQGCYDFKQFKKISLFGKPFKKISTKAKDDYAAQCIRKAKQKGISVFGIRRVQDTIKCFKGNEDNWSNFAINSTVDDCPSNTGTENSMFIYVELSKDQAAEFQPVGCFSLKELQKKKVIGKKKFKTMKAASSATPIQTCIQEAEKKKIKLFGIQQIKKNIFCRAGDDEKWSDGFNSAHDCSNDIGSKKSVFIYRKSQNSGSSERCTERGRSYGEGEEADVFEKEDEFNSFCKSCTCLGGKFSKCESKYMCDGALGGCEELIHPPEQCCPICKQQSCGQGRAVGDTWQKKEGQNCFHCSCEVGKKERCDPLYCIKLSCKKTVIPEGKCCPECDTTPTIPSWITIATTPTEEPFFPNPFPFDEPES